MSDLVSRLRERASAERVIQANNEAVADALKSQVEAFERRDGSHNTFAVRMQLDHKNAATRDASLAKDWDEAAARIERLEAALNLAVSILDGEMGSSWQDRNQSDFDSIVSALAE